MSSDTNPFRYLNSIISSKEYIPITDANAEEYWPAFINKGLSQQPDCLMYANEMNQHRFLNKKLHYDYLYHSIRPFKRKFAKWTKKDESGAELEKAVADYYKIRPTLAKEYMRALNKEQIAQIVKEMKDNVV